MTMKLVIYVAQMRELGNGYRIVGRESERGKMCLVEGVHWNWSRKYRAWSFWLGLSGSG